MKTKRRVFCLMLAILQICTAVSLTAFADPAEEIRTEEAESVAEEVTELREEEPDAELVEVAESESTEENAETEEETAEEMLTLAGSSIPAVQLNKTRLMTGQPIVIDQITGTGPFTYQWFVYAPDEAKGTIKATTDAYTPAAADYEKWIEVEVYAEGGAFVGRDRVYFTSYPVVYIDSETDQSSLTSDYEVPASLLIQGNNIYGCQYDGEIDLIAVDDQTALPGAKKPYRIELAAAASLFNLPTASYYVLISEEEYNALPDLFTYPDGTTPVKVEVSGVWTELVFNDNDCGRYRFCEYAAIAYFNAAANYPQFPGTPGFNQVRSYWLYNTLFEQKYTPGYYYIGANGEKVYVGFANCGKTQDSYLAQWASFPWFLVKSAEQYWLTRDEILEDCGVNNTTLYFGYGYPGTLDIGALRNRIAVLDVFFSSEDMTLESFANTYGDLAYRQAGMITAEGNLKEDKLTDADRAPADGLVPDGTPAVLELTVANSQAASVLVYVNGEKYTDEKGDAKYPVNKGKVNICIADDALDADFGTKNVVSFILFGKDGNYMKDATGRVLTDYISIIKTDSINAENYTVTFETDGGTVISEQPLTEGARVVRPQDPTKTGHVFIGWYEDAELTKEFSFATPITKNTTLYARWNKAADIIGKKFTVKFDTTGGLPMDDVNVDGADLLEEPTVPVKNGYEFVGWYTDEDLINQFDFETIIVKDYTLYARWKKDPLYSGNTYKITFVSDAQEAVPEQTVAGCELISIPMVPVKEGYDFMGWYADAQKTVLFDFTVPVTADQTVYARWSLRGDAPLRTVQFVLWKGGSVLPLQTVINGQRVNRPVDPSRYGYRFTGWYSDPEGTAVYDFNAPVYTDMTLYGMWQYVGQPSSSSGGGGGGAVLAKGITGTWSYDAKTDTWTFASNGKSYKDEWAEIVYDNSNPSNPKTAWFRFDANGKMITGWYTDPKGRRFYMNPLSTGSRGAMLTGWQQIDGFWYYFIEKTGSEEGVLLVNGTAPDGFRTDAQGRRIG